MTRPDVLTVRRASAHTAEAVALALVGAVVGVALHPAVTALGWAVVVGPLALATCWWLLRRPAVTLALVVATTVLLEDSPDVFLLPGDRFWGFLPGLPLHATDVLLVVLLAGVVVEWSSRHELPTAGRFTLPLVVLSICTLGGLVTGYLGGGNLEDIYNSTRVLVVFIALPFAAAHVLADDERRRRAIWFLAGLVAFRGAVAVVGTVVNPGASSSEYGAGIGEVAGTFYEPTMNFLLVLLLLIVVGLLLVRERLPRWVLVASPVAVAALVLSFRRSFWIAAVLGLLLMVVIATGRRGRPWLVLGALVLGASIWVSLAAGGSTDTTNPVLARAESLSPSQLRSNSGDRYRLDEQRNVVAEIQAHPLTGLGLGVPWTARHPLAEEHPGGRFYTHVTPLWFWLKLGPLGFLTYVWIQASAVLAGYTVWRRSRDTVERVAGLALAVGFVGLVVADLTGPFTGINLRLSVVVACLLGWLAAAELAARRPAGPATTPDLIAARPAG